MFVFYSLLFRYLVLIMVSFYRFCSEACNENLIGTTGVITSPNYPKEYGRNEDCQYTITSSTQNRITLVFEEFILQDNCNKDYLLVYDGGEDNGERLGKYCGDKKPDPLFALSGTLHLRFSTNRRNQYKGFNASYNTNPECTHFIEANEGSIKSPNFPENYSNNSICLYLIRSVNGLPISLTFTYFDLEYSDQCQYDYVKVKDGIGKDSNIVGDIMCGKRNSSIHWGTNGQLYIIFISDVADTRPGFSAIFQRIVECNSSLHATRGMILSPNYPDEYGSSKDCKYTIHSINKRPINLTFVDFELEYQDDCGFDYVKIYDGAKLIDTFCGSSLPVLSYLLPASFRILFHSDSAITKRGFNSVFEETKVEHTTSMLLSTSTESSTEMPTSSSKDHPSTATEVTSSVSGTDMSLETTDYPLSTGSSESSSTVPIVVGTLLGIAAIIIPVIVFIIIQKRKMVDKKQHQQMYAYNNTTGCLKSNVAKYGSSDEANQSLDPNVSSEYQYSTAENEDVNAYYSSTNEAIENNDDYELAKPMNTSNKMSDNQCFEEECDYVQQEDSYNVLNIHPAKHSDNDETAIYDRTVDSVYDTATTSTTENNDDLDTYDHTLNITD